MIIIVEISDGIMSDQTIEKFDDRNNKIYEQFPWGSEHWYEYDKNDNEIHYKNSEGGECWWEYDENNRMIYHKVNDGREYWYKYKKRAQYYRVKATKEEYEERKNREKINRFELLDLE